MNNVWSIRFSYFIGCMLIAALLGMAAYLEVYKGINPCPLCILQRIVLLTLGIIFFLAMALKIKKTGNILFGILGLITSLGGILLAGRQVWLQHAPPAGLGECGVSLQYMFKIFPLMEALKHVWQGGIECSQHGWVFMHLSLAEWSLLWFVLFFIFVIVQIKRAANE